MSDAYDWKIECEDGHVFITHARWSLVGAGLTIADAAKDLADDLPAIYGAFIGLDNLSDEAREMLAWIERTTGLRAQPIEQQEAEGGRP